MLAVVQYCDAKHGHLFVIVLFACGWPEPETLCEVCARGFSVAKWSPFVGTSRTRKQLPKLIAIFEFGHVKPMQQFRPNARALFNFVVRRS